METHENFCGSCDLPGILICCDNCPLAFHAKCVGYCASSCRIVHWNRMNITSYHFWEYFVGPETYSADWRVWWGEVQPVGQAPSRAPLMIECKIKCLAILANDSVFVQLVQVFWVMICLGIAGNALEGKRWSTILRQPHTMSSWANSCWWRQTAHARNTIKRKWSRKLEKIKLKLNLRTR